MKQTLKKLTNPPEQLTFFPEGSRNPASHTAMPESEKEKKMSAISGPKCLGQLERFNRAGLWVKTFSALLIGMEGWYSTRCKLTWKLRGTKSGRMYCQLAVSTLPIEGIGSGLLPSPNTMDVMDPKTDKAIIREMTVIRPGRSQLSNLRDVVVRQPERLLPTPTTSLGGAEPEGKTGRKLVTVVNSLLPTPTANEDAAGTLDGKMQYMLTHAAKEMDTDGYLKGSQLNPRFVAEMMGYPVDWTELPFLSTETIQSKPMETQ